MPKPKPVVIGQPAPDVSLQGEHGEAVQLSSLRAEAERGVVLGFLRHYG